MKKVVFFGAHTDDEMICAGTLHRLIQEGREVYVVTFSPAATDGDRRGTKVSSEIVTEEWHSALDAIGVKPDHRVFLDHTPAVGLDPFRQDICQYVFDFCEQYQPDAAFILSPNDENSEHAVVGSSCESVLRGRVDVVVRCQFPWNYRTGRTNLFVLLSEENMKVKQQVIDAYKSQHFRYRYGEMLMQYAHADGCSVKYSAAEKFEIIRSIV